MNNELMEQCRREAEEVYPKPIMERYVTLEDWHNADLEWAGAIKGYAAALYAERSKRRELTDEEIESIARHYGMKYGPARGPNPDVVDALRYARDNYPSTGLTVEKAVRVAMEWYESTIDYKGSDEEQLRARLTEAAKG